MSSIKPLILLLAATPALANDSSEFLAEPPVVLKRELAAETTEALENPVITWEYLDVPGPVTVQHLSGELYLVGDQELEGVHGKTLEDGAQLWVRAHANAIVQFKGENFAEFVAAPKDRYVVLRVTQ